MFGKQKSGVELDTEIPNLISLILTCTDFCTRFFDACTDFWIRKSERKIFWFPLMKFYIPLSKIVYRKMKK